MGDSENKVLGTYELLELLGSGTQGQVWKSRALKDIEDRVKVGDIVAVKVLGRSSGDPLEEKRFIRQAEILEHLDHVGICHYIDYFTDSEGEFDESRCLVMEYLDGTPLDEKLKRYPKGLPWDEVKLIFDHCIDGLAHAAEKGIIHRDLKPSNIFITHSGDAKLIDFGIARQEGGEETSTAGWRGSFDYMSPDFVQEEGFRGDEQSDVFSLGVCFFKALTGVLPFEPFGENAHIGYLNRWKDGEPPRPPFKHSAFRVLTKVKPFILASLSADREDRYETFREMGEHLANIRFRLVRHKGKDDYELIDVLGRGGFGEVFKGRVVSNGKLVAVKHLFAGRQASRFIKEARLLQKYEHPDIVEYIDFIEVEGLGDDKEFFLVMEYFPGMPGSGLNQRIRRAKTGMEPAEVLEIFIHYLSALQFLHESPRPIIHRDIKPGNLYSPPGQPQKAKLFDLGVARDVSGTLTTGMIPGTLDYMAPEFAKPGSDRGSPQSDIYAMGVTFYESLVGTKPFPRLPKADQEAFVQFVSRAQNPLEVEYRHLVFREVPRLEQICRKALDPDPKQRYARAGDMLRDLEALLEEEIAGEEHDPHDSPTRATIADPALIERLRAHAAGRPDLIPAAEMESLLKDTGSSAQAQPDWETDQDEDTDEPIPGQPRAAAGTPPPGTTPYGYAPPPKGNPLVKIAAVAVLLVALGIGGWFTYTQVFQGPSPEGVRTEFVATVKAMSEPEADEGYVRRLMLQQATARGKKVEDETYEVWWDNQIAEISDIAQQIPAAFSSAFDSAIQAKDLGGAEALADTWKNISDAVNFMDQPQREYLTQSDAMRDAIQQFAFTVAVSEIQQGLPEQIGDAAGLALVEERAQALAALRAKSWSDVPAELVTTEVNGLNQALRELATGYFSAEQARVVEQFEAGTDATSGAGAFRGLAGRQEALVALAPGAYQGALDAIAAAEGVYSRTQLVASTLQKLREAVPPTVETPAQVAAAEQAVLAYQAELVRPWEGISEADKTSALDQIRNDLVTQLTGYIQGLETAAVARYGKLAQEVPEDQQLQDVGETAPTLVAMLNGVYAASKSRVAAARGKAETEALAMMEVEERKRLAAKQAAASAAAAQMEAEAQAARKANRDAYAAAVTTLQQKVPAAIDADSLGAANQAALAVDEFAATVFKDIDAAEKEAVVTEINEALATSASAYVGRLRDAAIEKFNAQESAVPEYERLESLRADVPALAARIEGALDSAILDAEAALRELQGINEFTMALSALREKIPETITNPTRLKEAEAAAAEHRAMGERSYEMVKEADRVKALTSIQQTLTRKAESYVAALTDRAIADYEKLADGAAYQKALEGFGTQAPLLSEMVGSAYPDAVALVVGAAEVREQRVAFAEAVTAIEQVTPARISNAAERDAAESAAAQFTTLERADWGRVPEAERTGRLAEKRQALLDLATAYVEQLESTALDQYGKGVDGSASADELAAFSKASPTLSGWVDTTVQAAVARVADARQVFERLGKFATATQRIKAAVPKSLAGPTELAQAEKAATALTKAQSMGWDGVPEKQKTSTFAEIRRSLLDGGSAYIDTLRKTAIAKYDALESGDAERDQLQALEKEAPALVALMQRSYGAAVQSVDIARTKRDNRVQERKAEAERLAKAEAERARLEAERMAQAQKLAALKAAEQDQMQAVQDAWTQVQNSWAADDGADLTAAYQSILSPSFELPEFADAYAQIRDAFQTQLKGKLSGTVNAAERAIAGYRSYLYQVSYPPEGAYRAMEDEPIPQVQFNLPAMDDTEDVDLGINKAALLRLQAWRKASSSLSDPAAVQELAQRLGAIAEASRMQGDIELAGLSLMESAVLQSEPAVFPAEMEEVGEPAEILRWRAHANYQPEGSALDVLRDMERYASRGGAINEYDLRLVLFASYYSWRNAIDGENTYAARVRDSLTVVIAAADDSVSKDALAFLDEYIQGGADDEAEFPGLYLMNALTLIGSDAPVSQQAAAWMKVNQGDYQGRLDRIEGQTNLLSELLVEE